MSSQQYDVVIVGAGISGLTAAYNIKKRHAAASLLVLEANDRVGGRTLTVPLVAASGSDYWDIGGQWVGGCQKRIMNLLNEFNFETFKQYNEGKSMMQINGTKVKSYKGTIPSLSPLELLDLHVAMEKSNYHQRQLDVHNPFAHPKASQWDAMTAASYFDKILHTQAARDTFDAALRTVFGAETNQVSFLYYLFYIREAGDLKKLTEDTEDTAQEGRIKRGAQEISHELSSRIGEGSVRLNEEVASITQNDSGVTVVTKSGWTGVASRLVLAMPPKAIETIKFTPYLPADRRDFTKRMPMGNYIKFIVTYEKAFWRSAGYSGLIVSSGPPMTVDGLPAPISVSYDATTANGNPAMLGFIAGQMAVLWSNKSAKQRQNAVLQHLSMFFGKEVFSFLDYIEKDWNREPYTYGGPVSYLSVGGMESFSQAIRRVEGRIHFAGTETATVWTGYMDGAVQAGERAALEVLSHIQPNCLSDQDLQFLEDEKRARKSLSKRKAPKKRSFFNKAFVFGFGVVVISCAAFALSNYLNTEVQKLVTLP